MRMQLVEAIRAARDAGDTMGGVVGAVVRGLPPGLGSHTHWDRKLDGRICQALVSIHSVKAASIGAGIEVASAHGLRGSRRDPPRRPPVSNGPPTGPAGSRAASPTAATSWCGPSSSPSRPSAAACRRWTCATGEASTTAWERSDVTAIGAAPVIVEAMLALVLADALLDKLGGDAIADVDAGWESYCSRLAPWWRASAID